MSRSERNIDDPNRFGLFILIIERTITLIIKLMISIQRNDVSQCATLWRATMLSVITSFCTPNFQRNKETHRNAPVSPCFDSSSYARTRTQWLRSESVDNCYATLVASRTAEHTYAQFPVSHLFDGSHCLRCFPLHYDAPKIANERRERWSKTNHQNRNIIRTICNVH